MPNSVYILFRQITTGNGKIIFDGDTNYKGHLEQDQPINGLKTAQTLFSPTDTNLPINKFGVVRILTNGATSQFQVDDNVYTYNAGSGNANGFTVGAAGGITMGFANMEFVAAVLRKGVDSDTFKDDLLRWFKNKRNSFNNTWLVNNLPIFKL